MFKMLLVAMLVVVAAMTAPAMAQCCTYYSTGYVVAAPVYAAPVYAGPVYYSAPVASVYVGLQPSAYAYYPATTYSVGFGWGGGYRGYANYRQEWRGRGGFSSGGRHHR